MWKSPPKLLRSVTLIGSLLSACNALPQTATSAAPSPTPSAPTIPWETKFDALREYILQQPDQNATKGYFNGPSLQKTFADGQCLQVRFYNWDCNYDIPYKMRGVVKYLDDSGFRDPGYNPAIDPARWYMYGYYVDPDDGWNFYAEAHLTFGACGNRGPMSACGVNWCVDKNGKKPGYPLAFPIPEGQNPYIDPNDRDNLCPWMRDNGTASHTA
jgi:hypothetical protein